jgi:hypothetical protein
MVSTYALVGCGVLMALSILGFWVYCVKHMDDFAEIVEKPAMPREHLAA